MADAAHPPTPTLVALLICDQVIDDRLTNKKSAIGLFNAILVNRFPAQIQQLFVMAAITEVQQQAEIELRLIRDADNSVLFHARQEVRAVSPLATVDLLFGLRGVSIPQPGQYGIELLCAAELLGRRRFQVFDRRGEQPPAPGEAP